MTSRLWGSLTLVAALAQGTLAQAQECCTPQQVYRLEYQTVYEQQEMTAFRVEYDTVFDEQQVTSYRPVYETQLQERRTIVRTPLVETATRDEAFTQLEPVTMPTLYVHGARDGCIGVELAEGMEAFFPAGLEKLFIPDAGHFVHQERPDAVNAKLLEFLAPLR